MMFGRGRPSPAGARYPSGRGMRRLPFESNCLPIVCQFAKPPTPEMKKPLKTSMFSRASLVAGARNHRDRHLIEISV